MGYSKRQLLQSGILLLPVVIGVGLFIHRELEWAPARAGIMLS